MAKISDFNDYSSASARAAAMTMRGSRHYELTCVSMVRDLSQPEQRELDRIQAEVSELSAACRAFLSQPDSSILPACSHGGDL